MPTEHVHSPPGPQNTTDTPSNGLARPGSIAAVVRGGLSTPTLMAQYIQHMQQTQGNQATLHMLQHQQEQLHNRQTNEQDDEEVEPLEEEPSLIPLKIGQDMYRDIIHNKVLPKVYRSAIENTLVSLINLCQAFIASKYPNFYATLASATKILHMFGNSLKFWSELNPSIRAGVKFMIGGVLNKLEKSMPISLLSVSTYESWAADDAQTTQWMQTIGSVLDKVEKFTHYTDLTDMLKRIIKKNIIGTDEPPQTGQEPATGEQPNAAQPERQKFHTLDLKLIKLEMQDLTIARTQGEGESLKKGGLDSKSKITVRMFGKEFVVDEVHARLDWDFLFSIDATLMNKLITARTDFLIFEIENLILEKLNVGDDGLNELGVKIGKFKAGQLLEIEEFHGGYKRGAGFEFDINTIALNLPDPLPKVQTGANLLLDAKGQFKLLELKQFKVGSKFEVQTAQFTKQHLLIKEAAYALEYKGTTFKPMLNELLITKDRGIERISGGVSVEKFQPLDGLTIGGKALVGYEGDKKKFYLSINGTEIRLDYGIIQGYGDIEELKLYQDGVFTGFIKDLSFSVGMFSFNARNVSVDPNGVLTADEAEVVLGAKKKDKYSKDELKEIGAKEEDKDTFDNSISMKAKKIKIEKGKFSVEKFEKSLNLNNVYKINLFGGGIHGVIDPKKERALVAGKLSFPGKGPLWPLRVGINVPIPPTPFSVFAQVALDGGITATASGEIARDQMEKEKDPDKPLYDLNMKAQIQAELGISLAGGLQVGSQLFLAAMAYLQASTTLKASAGGEVTGKILFDPLKGQAEQDEANPLELKYKLQAELKAKVEAVLEFTAFLAYNKTLAQKTLGEWTLGSYNMEGIVGEKEGKLTDSVKTPNKDIQDDSLGGAIPSKINKLDSNIVQDLINDRLKDEKYLYRNAHDLLSKVDLTKEDAIKDVEDRLTKALGGDANRAKVQSTIGQVLKDLNKRQSLPEPTHLMLPDEWERYSSNGDDRKSIVPSDNALKAYHDTKDLDQKLKHLQKLKEHLHDYNKGGIDLTRGRKPMAEKLLLDVKEEKRLLFEKWYLDSIYKKGAVGGKEDIPPDSTLVKQIVDKSKASKEKYLYRDIHDLLSEEAALTEDLKQQVSKTKLSSSSKAIISEVIDDLNARREQASTHLMLPNEWKRYSSNGKERKGIKDTDAALEEYHNEEDLAQKLERLKTLKVKIRAYTKSLTLTHKRKKMAERLLMDTAYEKKLLHERQKEQLTP